MVHGRISQGYIDYLRSDDWKERRKILIEEAGGMCQECGATKNLQVHHLKYDNLGFEELGVDVEVDCKTCHRIKELEKGNDLFGEYNQEI
jgi:5-methylcytosine-specific restriction endonuclease McrA